MKTLLTVIIASLVFGLAAIAEPTNSQSQLLDRSLSVSNATYRYKLYVPANRAEEAGLPIIVFLHGVEARGSDNLRQVFLGLGPAIAQRKDFPFIAVFPQCPEDHLWPDPEIETQVLGELEQTINEFKADRKRIYLTGLSMGGYGVWFLAANNPGKFAAIVPVCGGVVPPGQKPWTDNPYANIAQKIGKTPTWIFHGASDPIVPVTEARKMTESIKAAGGDVRYTEYDGVGHNAWDKAYAERDLYSWMLSHTTAAQIPDSVSKTNSNAVANSIAADGDTISPKQPTTGPGGSNYTYSGVTKITYKSNGTDNFIFQPLPMSKKALPLIAFQHSPAIGFPWTHN